MAIPMPDQGYLYGGTIRFPEGEAKVYRARRVKDANGSAWEIEVPRSALPKEIVERMEKRAEGRWWYSLICSPPIDDPAFTPGEIVRATQPPQMRGNSRLTVYAIDYRLWVY